MSRDDEGKTCETQPHCACLTPSGDGHDEYQCVCNDDGTWRCSSCHAPLVTIATYERHHNPAIAVHCADNGGCGECACPCHMDGAVPGPHIATCKFADPEYCPPDFAATVRAMLGGGGDKAEAN